MALLPSLICAAMAYAQEHPATLLKKLKKVNSSPTITYDYTVKLVDANNGQITDSIMGRIYKNGQDYLDSNNVTIIAIQNGYYINLNNFKKSATILDVGLVREKLDLTDEEMTRDIVSIPDSLILKYGKIKNELTTDNYKIQISFSELQFTTITMVVDRKSLILKDMAIESNEYESGTAGLPRYKKLYHIYNIRYVVDKKAINIGRYFQVHNKGIVLNRKYSGYQINTITK